MTCPRKAGTVVLKVQRGRPALRERSCALGVDAKERTAASQTPKLAGESGAKDRNNVTDDLFHGFFETPNLWLKKKNLKCTQSKKAHLRDFL